MMKQRKELLTQRRDVSCDDFNSLFGDRLIKKGDILIIL